MVKVPNQPIPVPELIEKIGSVCFSKPEFAVAMTPEDSRGRYLHWDKMRHLKPPKNLTSEEWWLATKIARQSTQLMLPLIDKRGDILKVGTPQQVLKETHWLDQNTAGSLQAQQPILNAETRSTYLVGSLFEEAISSSQLEGAVTTRRKAKEMLRSGRRPADKSEHMIANNYAAMSFIREIQDEKLTPSMVHELHQIMTRNTLDDPTKAGVFRSADDDITVVDTVYDEELHIPPSADCLEGRMHALCEFANAEFNVKPFIHPIVQAIVLHYILAYDHPYVDGNGRTARALFYWLAAKSGYWLMEYVSISRIIKMAPAQYARAYLHSETDDNDVTYFVLHQLKVIRRAIEDLHKYLKKQMDGISKAEKIINKVDGLRGKLNHRQLVLIMHALKHPGSIYTIAEHQGGHGISYNTARTDLMQLSDEYELFDRMQRRRKFVFLAPDDLRHRIESAG